MNKEELMSLEEAIAHANEVAEEKYKVGFLCHTNPDDDKLNDCVKCGREHEQLAKWLSELKQYREIGTTTEFTTLKNMISKEQAPSDGLLIDFIKINDTPVTLPQLSYDILENLTESYNLENENIIADLRISKITVDLTGDKTETAEYELGIPMKFNLYNDGDVIAGDGTLLGGMIDGDFTKRNGEVVHITDFMNGYVDISTNTVNVASVAQKVVSVVFSGYIKTTRKVGSK